MKEYLLDARESLAIVPFKKAGKKKLIECGD